MIDAKDVNCKQINIEDNKLKNQLKNANMSFEPHEDILL